MDTALFAAVDVSGFSTNIQALLIAFILIAVGFAAFRYIKRVLRSG